MKIDAEQARGELLAEMDSLRRRLLRLAGQDGIDGWGEIINADEIPPEFANDHNMAGCALGDAVSAVALARLAKKRGISAHALGRLLTSPDRRPPKAWFPN